MDVARASIGPFFLFLSSSRPLYLVVVVVVYIQSCDRDFFSPQFSPFAGLVIRL